MHRRVRADRVVCAGQREEQDRDGDRDKRIQRDRNGAEPGPMSV